MKSYSQQCFANSHLSLVWTQLVEWLGLEQCFVSHISVSSPAYRLSVTVQGV